MHILCALKFLCDKEEKKLKRRKKKIKEMEENFFKQIGEFVLLGDKFSNKFNTSNMLEIVCLQRDLM